MSPSHIDIAPQPVQFLLYSFLHWIRYWSGLEETGRKEPSPSHLLSWMALRSTSTGAAGNRAAQSRFNYDNQSRPSKVGTLPFNGGDVKLTLVLYTFFLHDSLSYVRSIPWFWTGTFAAKWRESPHLSPLAFKLIIILDILWKFPLYVPHNFHSYVLSLDGPVWFCTVCVPSLLSR